MKQPTFIANPSTIESSSVIARGKAPKQSGFSLLEISLVIALGTMMTIGYLYNQSQDNQLSNAKVQAGYYLTVNDAVGKYMLNFYEDLKVIPPDCAQVRLTAGGVPSAIASTTNCKFTTGSASHPRSCRVRWQGRTDVGGACGNRWWRDRDISGGTEFRCWGYLECGCFRYGRSDLMGCDWSDQWHNIYIPR